MRAAFLVCALIVCGVASLHAQIWTNNGAYVEVANGAVVQMNGSMLNSSGTYNNSGTTTITGSATNNGTIGDSGTINLAGDWINNSTFTRYAGLVVMNGGAQNFAGSAITTFYNLTIEGGSIKTFNESENVDGTLDFIDGVLATSQTNVLTFTTLGNWINATSASYVDGPCAKNFNSTNEFQYPIGKVGRVNTVGVVPSSSTATTFRSEYFDNAFTNTTSVVSPLMEVSNVQYWNVDRISGSSNAQVRLYWISGDYSLPSFISNLPKLRVAMWQGTAWIDTGNAGTSGNYIAGNILSHLVTAWGLSPNQHFTLGTDTCDNACPVELDHFAAKQVGNAVDLEWLTRSEIENLGYEIERSPTGGSDSLIQTWETDRALAAKSPYGADYNSTDQPPANGAWTYTLYQRDLNGVRWLLSSQTVLFNRVPGAQVDLEVYPNPVTSSAINLSIGLQQDASDVQADIYDLLGRNVYSNHLGAMAVGFHSIALEDGFAIPTGHYSLVIRANGTMTSKSLIVSR